MVRAKTSLRLLAVIPERSLFRIIALGFVAECHDLLIFMLKMALDAKLSERRAVLLWIKTKLPQQYHRYIR